MAAPISLLFVTHQHVARVNLDKGTSSAPKVATRQADSIPSALLEALELDSAKARQVYVLSDEIFTQTLALNVSQTAGLSPVEVERALAFEAEPLSGIIPFESALGYRMLDARAGQRLFSIAQCPVQLRDGIQQSLHAQGVKLLGLCHPRGLIERALPADETGVQAWLAEAAKTVASSAPNCPLIGATEIPTPTQHFVLAGIALLVLAFAGCYGHWKMLSGERAALTAQIEKSKLPEKQLADVRKNIETRHKELQTLKAANELKLEGRGLLDNELGRYRIALSTLVEQLARSQPDDAAIDVIESVGSVVTVRGVSLDSKQADEWVSRLSVALKPTGWIIQPLDKTALRRFENGGPFAFTLQASRAPKAAKKGAALHTAAPSVSEVDP